MRKTFFLMALMCGSLAASNAFASLQLSLFAPNNSVVTIADGGVGDLDGLVNDSIVVLNQVVGGYTFSTTAASSSTTGFVSLQNMSILTTTGALAGKAGILVSRNNAPVDPAYYQVATQSNASVDYAAGAANSQAAVSYSTYLDTTNVLSVANYAGGVVSVVPGGTLMESATGNISTPLGGPSSGWVASGSGTLNVPGTNNLTMNLLAMADFSRINPGAGATHSVQFNGSFQMSSVPEPASMTVWALSGLLGLVVRRRWN